MCIRDSYKRTKKIRVGYQHLRTIMHIDQIAKVMVDKTIEEVQIGYDESEITLFLGDGTIIEIIVDSIHADVPSLDD